MRKLLALLLLVTASINSWGGTVTGQVQNASGGSVANGVFSFTLTQGATISGTASIVSSSVNCYTDANGNVVGEPNPLVLPVLSANTASGTLAAATYFARIAIFDGTGVTVASSEQTVILASNGTVIVTAPVKQPAGASGYNVYISTSTGTETLQGSVTGTPGSWANYSQSVPLVSGAALPASNSTSCKLHFNDEFQPSFVCYDVGLSSSTGNTIPGYPQYWYMSGGSAGTINIGQGTPQSNVCQGAGVFYPQAILATPPFNATQSINGGLNLNGFPLQAGTGTFSGNVTAPNIPTDIASTAAPTTANCVSKFNGSSALTCSALSDNGTTVASSENITAPNIPANVAGKNSPSDHTVYVSSAGNDSNDGLSWGTAKLTVQAAFNTATTSGVNPGNVVAACGTYAGPTTWYSNLLFWGWGSSDSTGNNFGVLPGTGTPCVKVTYSSTQTLTGLQNIFVRNIYFDFANSGAGTVLNSVVSSHFDDDTFNQCGNASTPCILMKTIGTAGPGQNTMLNVFRGTHCIANNAGGGANATCIKLLGQGSVNCVGACGAVTLNQFYNTVCAGGVLHCIDFELNTDTNRFYDVNCNQDVPIATSSCVSFNELTPASDQDANGEVVFNMCVTGTFSAQIRAGQSNGNDITACIGGNGLPSITVLGGTPNADIHTVGLDGVLKATQYSGVLGVAASLALSPPSGAVAGDGYVARTSTTGNQFFGTDNAQLLRSGNLWEFISGVTTVIPGVATADIGLVPITGTPVHLTSQTTATSNTVGIVGTNIAAGVYEFHATCSTTTSGTGTTGTMNLIWTDSGGTRTSPTNWALNSVTVTGVALAGALPIRVTSGSVTFSTTGTFGTSVYACDAWLTREN